MIARHSVDPRWAAREGLPLSARCKFIFVLAAAVSVLAGTVYAQDNPQSLGDLARQQRQKEQSAAKTIKVITNEEIPEHAASPAAAAAHAAVGEQNQTSLPASQNGPKQPAEHVKAQILAQKNQIASLQRQVDELNESIRYAPPNCVANCVGWNERQREKQQRVERMQAQLEDQKRHLEDMQDSARKQGFGSSVYDP
jgi:hypothetical protein